MSPDTGPVLLSQVGIRHVHVHVYRNDTLSHRVPFKYLNDVEGRL